MLNFSQIFGEDVFLEFDRCHFKYMERDFKYILSSVINNTCINIAQYFIMKQLTTFILFFAIINSAGSQTQIYNYLNHTSAWGVHSDGVDFSNNKYKSHYKYYMNGDTVIASNLYYKLFKTGVDSVYHLTNNTSSATLYDKYVGALREGYNCFYFIFSNDSLPIMLFDFKLDVTYPSLSHVPNMYANNGCAKPLVDYNNVNQYYLGTTLRSLFIFSQPYLWNLYEGIGSVKDILEPSSMCGVGFEYNSFLSCYTKDNNLIIIDNTFPCNLTLNLGGSNCNAKFCYNAVDSGYYISTTLYDLSTANDSIIFTYWELGFNSIFNPTKVFNWNTPYFDSIFPYKLYIKTQSGCLASYSDKIKIGTTCTFLPLHFASFNVINTNNKPHLFWQTSNEINIKNFIVQRSVDGNNFIDIANVLASNKPKNKYEFIDEFVNENSNANKYYYRLKYVETNGKSSFSNIESIFLATKNIVTVFPNPAKNVVTVNATNAKEILLLDYSGRLIKKLIVQNQSTKVDLQNVKAGMYFLQIRFKDNAVVNEKLVVD